MPQPKKPARATAKKPAAARRKRAPSKCATRRPTRWTYTRPAARPSGTVTSAVESELDAIRKTDVALANGAIAATALALAATLDDKDGAATAKATCARALTETMEKLRALAPAEQKDGIDALTDRRARRRAAGSAAT